jgi:hypothetical protein
VANFTPPTAPYILLPTGSQNPVNIKLSRSFEVKKYFLSLPGFEPEIIHPVAQWRYYGPSNECERICVNIYVQIIIGPSVCPPYAPQSAWPLVILCDLMDMGNINQQQVNLLSLFGLTRKHEKGLTFR